MYTLNVRSPATCRRATPAASPCYYLVATQMFDSRMQMKRKIAGVLLVLGLGAGTMFASDAGRDRRDIRHDKARIAHDRRDLHRDLRRGEYGAARHERRQLRRDSRELHHDRQDLYWDRR
jgi:hypothetical protein